VCIYIYIYTVCISKTELPIKTKTLGHKRHILSSMRFNHLTLRHVCFIFWSHS